MSAEPLLAGPSPLELDLLASALAHDPGGAAVLDGEGRVLWANEAANGWVHAGDQLGHLLRDAGDLGDRRAEVFVQQLPTATGARWFLIRRHVDTTRARHLELLRQLHSLTSERRMTLEQRLGALFRIAAEHFGMIRAVQARVEGRFHVVERCWDPTGVVSVGDERPVSHTWCHHTLRRNQPVGVHHATCSDHADRRYQRAFPYEAYLAAPVFVDAVRVGTLALAHDEPVAPFTQEDRAMAGLLAQWVGHELARDHDRQLYLKAQEDLDRLARTDVLTGLPNRRAILEALHWQVAYARRARLPLTVVLCDLDHFKRVNDRHGHEGGDLALKAFARVCREVKRETDLAGRWGGEEFLLVLPNTDIDGAQVFGERFLGALRQRQVRMPDGSEAGIRASLGAARVWTTESEDAAISRADAALYRAKESGRDRMVVDRGATPAPRVRSEGPR